MKTKVIRWFVVVAALVPISVVGQKEGELEDRFGVLTKSVAPVIGLLTPSGSDGNHALDLQASITEASGLPAQPIGAPVRVAFEFPDRLLIQFPTAAGTATICRDRQTVWAFPATLFKPLVEKVGAGISTTPLPPFEIDETKAVLLPALFDVRDAGLIKFGDREFRVLDVRLVTESKREKSEGWPIRLWIDPVNHNVTQIALRSGSWSATLTISKLEIAPSLPSSTWQPTSEQHDEVVAIPGTRIASLLELALKQSK